MLKHGVWKTINPVKHFQEYAPFTGDERVKDFENTAC